MVLALLAALARAGTVFEGEEVVEAIGASVEVTDSLLQVLQAQARYDRHLSHLSTTIRWAPGKFELSDGQLAAGNLARYQVGGAVGLGHPSKFGAHFGLAMDGIGETGAATVRYGGYQEILYFGVGVKHFQLTLNARVDFLAAGSGNLDPWLQFQAEDDPGIYREALPFDNRVDTTHGKTWSLYHGPSGAWAYITYGDGTIYDVRAQLQPLARILPPLWGLPALGLRWLDDRANSFTSDESTSAAPTGFEALEPPEKRFQNDLGTDDALGIGMRTRVVVEWLPTPAFRYAELGLVKNMGELGDSPFGFGFRGAVAVPEDRFRVALESFGMVGFGRSKVWSTGRKGHFALSYSYSVPDGTTYIPIPDAHVFGLQAVLGAPEASKPIVPLVRGLDAE